MTLSKRKSTESLNKVKRVKKARTHDNSALFPHLSALKRSQNVDVEELRKKCLEADLSNPEHLDVLTKMARRFKFLNPGQRLKAKDAEAICKVVDQGISFSHDLSQRSQKKSSKALDTQFDETVSRLVSEAIQKEISKVKKTKDCNTLAKEESILCKLEKPQEKMLTKNAELKLREEAESFQKQVVLLENYAKENKIPSDKDLTKFKKTILKLQDLTSKKFDLSKKDFTRINNDIKKVQDLDQKVKAKKEEIVSASKKKSFSWALVGYVGRAFSKLAAFIGDAVHFLWSGNTIVKLAIVAAIFSCITTPITVLNPNKGWFGPNTLETTACAHFASTFFESVNVVSNTTSSIAYWTALAPILVHLVPYIPSILTGFKGILAGFGFAF
jgi:hypothetical protein